MGEILLIRHGETDWNREEFFRGRADVGLSEWGRRQAELLAEALRARPPEAVYSSPLSRALDTAAPLARLAGLRVVSDPRLVDMSFGQWEGRSQAEVEASEPELYLQWRQRPEQFRAPGGETLDEVLARAWPAVAAISARHELAVVVSHRVVCKLLMCAALGTGTAAFWRVRLDTASVSVLRNEGDLWVVTRLNDTHHLAGHGPADRADF